MVASHHRFDQRSTVSYDLQNSSGFFERVADGVGGDTPALSTLLLAFLRREMAFARPLCRVNMVAASKAFDLLSRAFGRGLHVPTGFMGADEVPVAFRANPLASKRVVVETFEVDLDGFDLFFVGEGGGVR